MNKKEIRLVDANAMRAHEAADKTCAAIHIAAGTGSSFDSLDPNSSLAQAIDAELVFGLERILYLVPTPSHSMALQEYRTRLLGGLRTVAEAIRDHATAVVDAYVASAATPDEAPVEIRYHQLPRAAAGASRELPREMFLGDREFGVPVYVTFEQDRSDRVLVGLIGLSRSQCRATSLVVTFDDDSEEELHGEQIANGGRWSIELRPAATIRAISLRRRTEAP